MCRLAPMALLALSCTSDPETPPAPTADIRSQTLVFALASDPTTTLPVLASSLGDTLLSDALAPSGGPGGWMARSEWVADDVLHTDINKRLSWSDGPRLGLRDLRLSAQLAADPAVGSPLAPTLHDLRIGDTHDGPWQQDHDTLEWRFSGPGDPSERLLRIQALRPTPAHLLAEVDPASLRGHSYHRSPVSAGWYTLARWDRGSLIELKARAAPVGLEFPQRVLAQIIPDAQSRLDALETGAVDVVSGVPPHQLERLGAAIPGLRVVERKHQTMEFVAWNLHSGDDSHPIFGDLRVRRALALAVDVERLMADVLTRSDTLAVAGQRAVGTVSPPHRGHADDLPPLPHDPAVASAILEQAGWVDSDGDGVRERDGQPLRFRLLTTAGHARRSQVVVLLQAMWAQVGVAMEPEALEATHVFGRLRRRDFDAALVAWNAEPRVDMATRWACGDVPYNLSGWCDPETEAQLAAAHGATDAATREAAWVAAQTRIYSEQPQLFLYWLDSLVAVRPPWLPPDLQDSPYVNLSGWRRQQP